MNIAQFLLGFGITASILTTIINLVLLGKCAGHYNKIINMERIEPEEFRDVQDTIKMLRFNIDQLTRDSKAQSSKRKT